ncbi:MAG: DJ-1/PfpI family protein [Gallionella sp.]|nr:DJ-1/PfpI family protein [Gallionella sp.]
MLNVAILMFDNVEVLDFAGPFEVFGVSGGRENKKLYDVFTVSQHVKPVTARNNLSINCDYTFDTMPDAHVFVIPGGLGTRRIKHSPSILHFVQETVAEASYVVSVCSGALLLAKAGLLNGLQATSHQGALDELEADAPNCTLHRDARLVDNGKIVTSAGIGMGIDASLYTVAKHYGLTQAQETARYMEYDWNYQVIDGKKIVLAQPLRGAV